MKKLATLWKRPSRDGKRYSYYLLYYDETGRQRQKSLGHTDARKAERQRAQFERELRMGHVEPESMKLSDFLNDCLYRSRGQVRENTLREYKIAMEHFIKVVGNIDYQNVSHNHGEKFVQACLDAGNALATARKKIRTLKRLFQLAIERGQLDSNPLRRVRQPKVPTRQVRTYSNEESRRFLETAAAYKIGWPVRWDLIILTALCTAMRRGEILNTTIQDIDFAHGNIHVEPKRDTKLTWEWHIKDTDRRTLPLTDELAKLLEEHISAQPNGYPYVFVPPFRYDRIQQFRQMGKWSLRKGACPLNNFDRQFRAIRKRAQIENGEFHDFRRTCLSNWLANGLREHDVMRMAGHASFETTRQFYLAVRGDLLEKTREATTQAVQGVFIARASCKTSGKIARTELPMG